MSTITVPEALTRPTAFERALLHAAAGADRYVSHRLAGRNAVARRTVERQRSDERRRLAEALGPFGVRPR